MPTSARSKATRTVMREQKRSSFFEAVRFGEGGLCNVAMGIDFTSMRAGDKFFACFAQDFEVLASRGPTSSCSPADR